MNKFEILEKAKYVLFPIDNKFYDEETYKEIKDLVKLPIIEDNEKALYLHMGDNNRHHYTNYYHINYVLPELDKLFHFGYNKDDFNLIDFKTNQGDLSYLKPKKEYSFEITSFEENLVVKATFDDLKPLKLCWPSYRDMYIGFHSCTKLVNLDIDNNKKIFISGDSQSIGDILILACYYKEVWYFDNRTGQTKDYNDIIESNTTSYADKYKDIVFDDVLIQLFRNPLSWYTDINLK